MAPRRNVSKRGKRGTRKMGQRGRRQVADLRTTYGGKRTTKRTNRKGLSKRKGKKVRKVLGQQMMEIGYVTNVVGQGTRMVKRQKMTKRMGKHLSNLSRRMGKNAGKLVRGLRTNTQFMMPRRMFGGMDEVAGGTEEPENALQLIGPPMPPSGPSVELINIMKVYYYMRAHIPEVSTTFVTMGFIVDVVRAIVNGTTDNTLLLMLYRLSSETMPVIQAAAVGAGSIVAASSHSIFTAINEVAGSMSPTIGLTIFAGFYWVAVDGGKHSFMEFYNSQSALFKNLFASAIRGGEQIIRLITEKRDEIIAVMNQEDNVGMATESARIVGNVAPPVIPIVRYIPRLSSQLYEMIETAMTSLSSRVSSMPSMPSMQLIEPLPTRRDTLELLEALLNKLYNPNYASGSEDGSQGSVASSGSSAIQIVAAADQQLVVDVASLITTQLKDNRSASQLDTEVMDNIGAAMGGGGGGGSGEASPSSYTPVLALTLSNIREDDPSRSSSPQSSQDLSEDGSEVEAAQMVNAINAHAVEEEGEEEQGEEMDHEEEGEDDDEEEEEEEEEGDGDDEEEAMVPVEEVPSRKRPASKSPEENIPKKLQTKKPPA